MPKVTSIPCFFRTGIALMGGMICAAAAAQNPTRLDLSSQRRADQVHQIKAMIEVRGELKLNSDGKQVDRTKIQVGGELLYDERILAVDAQHRPTLVGRHYRDAKADIHIGSNRLTRQLPDDRRLIAAEVRDGIQTLYSPLGPLSRDELDLVDIQASSALVSHLLPQREVAVGESWSHEPQTVAPLMGLEAAHSGKLTSRLRKVADNLCIIDLQGTLSGSVAGVASDLEIQGIYNFDLQQQQISWINLLVKESRAIGHAQAGFEVEARVRMASTPLAQSEHLTDDVMQQLAWQPDAVRQLVQFQSEPGKFRLLHKRDWQVMVDRADVTVMRLVRQGDLVAQANFAAVDASEAQQPLTLDQFQSDIRRALGDNFRQFAAADESTNEQELRVLRVVVGGVADDLPIHWIYYYLNDRNGRSLSCIFTMDASLIEVFGAEDIEMIATLQLLE